MIQCCNMKYSDIRKKDVVDSDGEKVGEVIDAILDTSNNCIDLKYFVMGGGLIEELLESIGVRPDIDPVCSIDDIDSISDKVYLKVNKSTLLKTVDKGVITENDAKFSEVAKIKIEDSDGFKVGNIIDLWFDSEGTMWFLIGGGFFEELLEKIHAQPDCDLLAPAEIIQSVSRDNIVFSQTKFQLESTCVSEYEREKARLAKEKDKKTQMAKVRIGPPTPGMVRT
ncbi:PRC-barrel domain containing protein [Candidatus Thorarchaeota archaeon]|nr:MAG: PRC-barrel domain containing protein [Candidatus Thorarchaeota archaeon]